VRIIGRQAQVAEDGSLKYPDETEFPLGPEDVIVDIPRSTTADWH
jgi:hypothetical protein